jgi:outer membrane protein assembly factor BamB
MLRRILQFVSILLTMAGVLLAAEDWPQFKFDSEHTGNAVTYELPSSLGLVGSIPLTDAVFASPAIVEDHIFILDGSGVLFCVDANTLDVVWRFESSADPRNCNNVCSPAVISGKGPLRNHVG